jgi:hypothetical protein
MAHSVLSPQQIAHQLGVSPSRLRRMLNGKHLREYQDTLEFLACRQAEHLLATAASRASLALVSLLEARSDEAVRKTSFQVVAGAQARQHHAEPAVRRRAKPAAGRTEAVSAQPHALRADVPSTIPATSIGEASSTALPPPRQERPVQPEQATSSGAPLARRIPDSSEYAATIVLGTKGKRPWRQNEEEPT